MIIFADKQLDILFPSIKRRFSDSIDSEAITVNKYSYSIIPISVRFERFIEFYVKFTAENSQYKGSNKSWNTVNNSSLKLIERTVRTFTPISPMWKMSIYYSSQFFWWTIWELNGLCDRKSRKSIVRWVLWDICSNRVSLFNIKSLIFHFALLFKR